MSAHFDTDSFMRMNTLAEAGTGKGKQQTITPADVSAGWSSDRSEIVKANYTTRIKYKRCVGGKIEDRTTERTA